MGTEQKWGKVSAVRVAQLAAGVVIVRKKQSRIAGCVGALVKQVVYGSEHPRQIVNRHRVLTAQVGLEIGHQQRSGKSFARDICKHQAQSLRGQLEKIVIIPTYLPRLNATPHELKCAERR